MIHIVNFIIIIFIVVIFNLKFLDFRKASRAQFAKNSEMKREDSSAAHFSPIYTWEGGWPNRHFTFFLP